MNVHLPSPGNRWPARLVTLAVVAAVLALAAATFVLSYTGVHVIALHAGVSARFARVYPATFDAVLVIACLTAVMLRGARWWARSYAWLAIILVVGVAGAADALHAMNVDLPRRTTEGVVAATPWVLVLLGFSLMLTMIRHSRTQHTYRQPTPATADTSASGATLAFDPSPALDTPRAVGAAPDVDPTRPLEHVIISGTNPHLYAVASETTPDPASDPAEPAMSWHDYWDAEPQSASASQTCAQTPPDPEDRHLPAPVMQNPRNPRPDPEDEHRPQPDPDDGHHQPQPDSEQQHHESPPDSEERHNHRVAEQTLDPHPSAAEAESPAHLSQPSAPGVDATAPFATVPRLNRVRSSPTPPEQGEE